MSAPDAETNPDPVVVSRVFEAGIGDIHGRPGYRVIELLPNGSTRRVLWATFNTKEDAEKYLVHVVADFKVAGFEVRMWTREFTSAEFDL